MKWKMPFGMYSGWDPDNLPEVLRPYYCYMDRDETRGYDPQHHLTGWIAPTQEVLDAITAYFNQYLHLKMPFGQQSYVWPSEGEYRPVRCARSRAIDHFKCRL